MAVLVILTAKAGWFRRDDELAAHERAIRSLGWSPVSLPVRPAATTDELAGFLERAQPALIWVRDGVALPADFPEHLGSQPVPVVSARPRGVDALVLEASVRPGPREVAGDVSVMTATPSPRLRDTVARLRVDGTVVAYGAGWGGGCWFEPEGRAALVALASAPVHLVEMGPDGSLPHTAYSAAAVGAVPLLLCGEPAELTAPATELRTAGSPEEAAAVVAALRADPAQRAEQARAARAWADQHRLEPQWRTILAPHGVDR